jgi:hypothetical protein
LTHQLLLQRYQDWLESALAEWEGAPPLVLLCSDEPELALQALQPHGARTLVRARASLQRRVSAHLLTRIRGITRVPGAGAGSGGARRAGRCVRRR